MKPKILIRMAIVVLVTGFTGCYKDILSPGQDPTAPPQAVSFSGDLVPLFETNCATSGCHDGVPGHKPSLTAANAYNAITSGGYINTIVPGNSIIYGAVKSGSMPPSGALKPADIQKILDWIRNGAPNN
ncbi:MAG: cytochrome c [Bacteroidota bacterium]|nr:cytochrome c [Bacteroidota bacterium]